MFEADETGLPLVDSHAVSVDASADATWDALWAVLRRSFGGRRGARVFARAVGVRDMEPLVGFRVADEVRGERLALEGEHRFSRYRLAFSLEGGRLTATTHASFPGVHGRAYRALIVPTGLHARVVKRLLAATARGAARGSRRAA